MITEKLDDIDKKILEYLFEGKTAKEIGQVVFKSSRTIEWRLKKIREDHGCKNNVQLAAKLNK